MENLGKLNPTIINGEALGHHETRLLHHGDMINISERLFRFETPDQTVVMSAAVTGRNVKTSARGRIQETDSTQVYNISRSTVSLSAKKKSVSSSSIASASKIRRGLSDMTNNVNNASKVLPSPLKRAIKTFKRKNVTSSTTPPLTGEMLALPTSQHINRVMQQRRRLPTPLRHGIESRGAKAGFNQDTADDAMNNSITENSATEAVITESMPKKLSSSPVMTTTSACRPTLPTPLRHAIHGLRPSVSADHKCIDEVIPAATVPSTNTVNAPAACTASSAFHALSITANTTTLTPETECPPASIARPTLPMALLDAIVDFHGRKQMNDDIIPQSEVDKAEPVEPAVDTSFHRPSMPESLLSAIQGFHFRAKTSREMEEDGETDSVSPTIRNMISSGVDESSSHHPKMALPTPLRSAIQGFRRNSIETAESPAIAPEDNAVVSYAAAARRALPLALRMAIEDSAHMLARTKIVEEEIQEETVAAETTTTDTTECTENDSIPTHPGTSSVRPGMPTPLRKQIHLRLNPTPTPSPVKGASDTNDEGIGGPMCFSMADLRTTFQQKGMVVFEDEAKEKEPTEATSEEKKEDTDHGFLNHQISLVPVVDFSATSPETNKESNTPTVAKRRILPTPLRREIIGQRRRSLRVARKSLTPGKPRPLQSFTMAPVETEQNVQTCSDDDKAEEKDFENGYEPEAGMQGNATFYDAKEEEHSAETYGWDDDYVDDDLEDEEDMFFDAHEEDSSNAQSMAEMTQHSQKKVKVHTHKRFDSIADDDVCFQYNVHWEYNDYDSDGTIDEELSKPDMSQTDIVDENNNIHSHDTAESKCIETSKSPIQLEMLGSKMASELVASSINIAMASVTTESIHPIVGEEEQKRSAALPEIDCPEPTGVLPGTPCFIHYLYRPCVDGIESSEIHKDSSTSLGGKGVASAPLSPAAVTAYAGGVPLRFQKAAGKAVSRYARSLTPGRITARLEKAYNARQVVVQKIVDKAREVSRRSEEAKLRREQHVEESETDTLDVITQSSDIAEVGDSTKATTMQDDTSLPAENDPVIHVEESETDTLDVIAQSSDSAEADDSTKATTMQYDTSLPSSDHTTEAISEMITKSEVITNTDELVIAAESNCIIEETDSMKTSDTVDVEDKSAANDEDKIVEKEENGIKEESNAADAKEIQDTNVNVAAEAIKEEEETSNVEPINDEEPEWQDVGHEWIGHGVRRYFDGHGYVVGKITHWAPPLFDQTTGQETEPAVFRIQHDDGDIEVNN